jgi:hypothetical protein
MLQGDCLERFFAPRVPYPSVSVQKALNAIVKIARTEFINSCVASRGA